jgi:DnaJ-domain-containing protein 1
MRPLSVYAILKAWHEQWGADGVAHALGISRRTLFYKLARATKAELKAAFEQLLREEHWTAQRLQERLERLAGVEQRFEQLEEDYTALERWNQQLAAENRQLHEALARATDALARATGDGTPGATGQDPYPVLGITRNAPMEVIEAAYRALAKIHHPDAGGSTAAMQHINRAYDQVRRRHRRSY